MYLMLIATPHTHTYVNTYQYIYTHIHINTILVHTFPFTDVLCDPTYLIWRIGTPSDGLLAEVFRGFTHL